MKKSKFVKWCQNCIRLKKPCCQIHSKMIELMASLDRIEREQKMRTRYRAFEGALSRTKNADGVA